MATWPTSIPTDANLYLAVNELQTNLSSGINAAVTTLPLNSTTSFPTVGLVLIDNEIIKYTGVAGATLTGCTRAFDGTSAATHSAAAIVSFAICAAHHNVSKDEIIALATYLSNNLGTGAQPLANGSRALASNGSGKIIESSVTSTELGYLSGVTSAIQTQLGLKAPLASPTFTGTVTTPSVTFNSTSGVIGTTTNNAAAAGSVGEYIESNVTTVASLVSTVQFNDLTSMSLTAGDWDVSLLVYYSVNGATGLGTNYIFISTTPGNNETGEVVPVNAARGTLNGATEGSLVVPCYRMSLSGTTTVYAKVAASWSGSGPVKACCRLSARRVR